MSKDFYRTKSIGVKVNEDDFIALQTLSAREHKPLAEWCRDVLIRAARNPLGSPIEQALLAELMALRTIISNLVYAQGEGKVTPQQMSAFIERADRTKLKRAFDFLAKLHTEEDYPSIEQPQAAGGGR